MRERGFPPAVPPGTTLLYRLIGGTMGSDIRVPDIGYWRAQIKCMAACPVHTDARRYVRAIAEGNDELAYLIARGPNPLASICGRICGAPCEAACRRGDIDDPIAIRALKRYVCEQFGAEADFAGHGTLAAFLKQAATTARQRECSGRDELLPLLQSLLNGGIEPVSGKSVGIIGSGPAGLAAAHDLALFGFAVTIYEMEPVLAGMLATGVPEYRLPRALIQAEVDAILALGVTAVTNCCVGKDVSFTELRAKHDAVVVAVGAKRSRALSIPGAEGEGVFGGVEYLRDLSLGKPTPLGGRVVVIGGGNVAYDVGRSVLRQASVDMARSALRAGGVEVVFLCSLESLDEMPADDIEIIEGDEEGIVRLNSLGPQEILRDGAGRVRAVRFQKCLRVFDAGGRFSPLFDADDVREIPCDSVLTCIGQEYDISFIDAARDGLELTPRGLIRCHPETGVTSAPDIFVAGDLAYGTKLLIHAVASGKAVAREMYERVSGRRLTVDTVELHFPVADYRREPGYESVPRVHPSTAPVNERLGGWDREVERVLTSLQARCEAGRCLDCGVNTIFDGTRCILCGGCVDVCPERCLRIAGVEQISLEDPSLAELIGRHLDGLPAAEASFILKDEERCIRCALCAERCPTGAITMERFQFTEVLKCQTG